MPSIILSIYTKLLSLSTPLNGVFRGAASAEQTKDECQILQPPLKVFKNSLITNDPCNNGPPFRQLKMSQFSGGFTFSRVWPNAIFQGSISRRNFSTLKHALALLSWGVNVLNYQGIHDFYSLLKLGGFNFWGEWKGVPLLRGALVNRHSTYFFSSLLLLALVSR